MTQSNLAAVSSTMDQSATAADAATAAVSFRHAQSLIELRDLTKTYHSDGLAVEILHGITLKIYEGEFIAIMGQSGSGKTTLMNILGCLDRPSTGTYLFAGHDVSGLGPDDLALLRRNIFGFVFQRYNLIATETATENVEIPAIYAGMSRRERIKRAQDLLCTLGLDDRLDYRPTQLSGGQQQRVSIARALMNGGRVILADEPTGALDSTSGAEVLQLLGDLHRRGHTVILITHNAAIANQAERILEIKDGVIVSDSGHVPRQVSATALPTVTSEDSSPARDIHLLPDVLEAIGMAMRSLRMNVFRTVLTLLGIIIGVGAVVAMLALGDGSKQAVLARMESMGTDLLLVRPGAPGVRGAGDLATLVREDADALAELPNVLYAVPDLGGAVTLRVGDNDYQSNATSTTADYIKARNWPVARGAFFSDDDVDSYAPVVVLGQTVLKNIFPGGTDPLGSYLVINNIPFQVIGVLSPKGATSSGNDMDDAVFVPLTTARMRLFGKRYIRGITVQVADVAKIDETESAIKTLLMKRHLKLDFQIRNMASLLESATETQNTLTVLLSSIAAISLLVGGIGVMNIMLVSVMERTREIGIRMATGAQMLHILLQFITEALIVCSVGGVAGVVCGLAGAWIASRFGSPVVYSLPPVLLAFGSAFAVGLLFGYLPARRAAKLDPVIALAAE
ncbi:MAG: MacB family efflux pump subunit [Proteobacteria bacterium]|nr:MacB family efflux pump subunit [Pseudomonadota bacterium]